MIHLGGNDIHSPRKEWPQHGIETVKTCPLCGASGRRVLYSNMIDRNVRVAPGHWTFMQCNRCGCAYLDPRPTSETVGLAYREYFTHHMPSDSKKLLGIPRLRRAISNDYRNAYYGTCLHPGLWPGRWITRLLPTRRRSIDAQMRHLRTFGRSGRLLDVGCGNGDFLALAESAGWSARGIDVDEKAVDVARRRGLSVTAGRISDLSSHKGKVDLITLCHVIEHVHDPIELLRECYATLRPGGSIWVETPNVDSLGHRRFGVHWYALDPPRHLVLFNWRIMRLALTQCGFVAVTGMPYRPLAQREFANSAAISLGRAPNSRGNSPPRLRCHAWAADFRARQREEAREVVTVSAKKPKSSPSALP